MGDAPGPRLPLGEGADAMAGGGGGGWRPLGLHRRPPPPPPLAGPVSHKWWLLQPTVMPPPPPLGDRLRGQRTQAYQCAGGHQSGTHLTLRPELSPKGDKAQNPVEAAQLLPQSGRREGTRTATHCPSDTHNQGTEMAMKVVRQARLELPSLGPKSIGNTRRRRKFSSGYTRIRGGGDRHLVTPPPPPPPGDLWALGGGGIAREGGTKST